MKPLLSHRKMYDYISEDHPVMAVCEISALTHANLDVMTAAISEICSGMSDAMRPQLRPKSEPGARSQEPVPTATASVIESWVSSTEGKSLLVIVRTGILKVGGAFVSDRYLGRIRTLQVCDSRFTVKNPPTVAGSELALPGLPVVVGVSLDTTAVASEEIKLPGPGSVLFQLPKQAAEDVHAFRNLLIEYKSREAQGTLFVTSAEQVEPDHDMPQETLAGVDSASNPQVSPLSTPEVSKLLTMASRDEFSTERTIPVIFRAGNVGMLEAIASAAQVVAMRYGVRLNILRSGVGEISPTDLMVARVAIENKEPTVHIFCLNSKVGATAKSWLSKNKDVSSRINIEKHTVFLDVLQRVRDEIKAKFGIAT